MQRLTFALVCACISMGASTLHAQHQGDINLTPAETPNGLQLQTGLTSGNGTIEPNVRVFTGSFGDSGFPQFTSNPGFEALPGTFDPSTRLGFSAPFGFGSCVVVNGEPFIGTTNAVLEVKFLTLSTVIGAAPNPGFDLAVQPNGGWHRHFNFTISAGSGSIEPGVYVLPLVMYSTDPLIADSEVVYVLFDYQSAPGELDAFATLVQTYWVDPQPAACVGDIDGDGFVASEDLATLLGAWGPAEATPLADLDDDGSVGASDLATLLGAWGSCP